MKLNKISVPEDPSAGPEVSFQPLGTAEVCKRRTYKQKETISKVTTG